MSLGGSLKACALAAAAAGVCASAQASKLVEVRSVDDEHIMIYWQDAKVTYQDDGKGPTAFMGHETKGGEVITTFGPPLDTTAAQTAGNYTLASADDAVYSQPLAATEAYRKTKVSGTDSRWPEAKFTLEHTVYLKLPQKLQQGKHYTLRIAPATNTDITSREITFDIYISVSEAIHVNMIGYNPEHTAVKSADLYMWMGDGGARDYSGYVGKPITLYNVSTGERSYEDVVAKETMLISRNANLDERGKLCQYWPTAGYLMCDKFKWQPIHYPDLVKKMQAAVIAEAMRKNVVNAETWPSRRSSDTAYGWFQSTQACDAMCIAHAVAADGPDQDRLLRAMILESDYGLGRNCLNMVL